MKYLTAEMPVCDSNIFNIFRVNRNETVHIKGTDLAISGDFEKLFITNYQNAFKRGADCVSIRIYDEVEGGYMRLLDQFGFNLLKVLDIFSGEEEGLIDVSEYSNECKVYLTKKPGVRSFSMAHLKRVKPLKEAPNKWCISHAVRMLINNQCHGLRTTGRYTDDYAYDSATNYGEGDYCRFKLAKELIESPSGWWISDSKGDNTLGINCHSFNYKSCSVDLKRPFEHPEEWCISKVKLDVEPANIAAVLLVG